MHFWTASPGARSLPIQSRSSQLSRIVSSEFAPFVPRRRRLRKRRRRLSDVRTTAPTEAVARYWQRDPGLLFNPRRGVNGVKARAPPPYLHIKKAIRGTRLCKRRGWPRVPGGDEKNFEIRALINLLSGTAATAVEGGSDEVFVGLSSLSRGLSQASREFKVPPCRRGPGELRHVFPV